MPYARKEANKEYQRRWYQENKEKHKARVQARYYANHEENKKKSAAYQKARRDLYGRKDHPLSLLSDQERLHIYKPLQRWLENPRLSETVPELVLQAEQKWHQRQERKIEMLIYNREKSKRRKAQLKSVTYAKIKPKHLRQRFDDFDGCCAYCGKKLQWGARDCHIEHIVPLSKGGGHVLSNIVYACKTCNFNKYNHDAEQWYKSKPFFSQKRWNRILAVMGVKGKNFGQLSLL